MNDPRQANNYQLICDLLVRNFCNTWPEGFDNVSFQRDVEQQGVSGLVYAALRDQSQSSTSIYNSLERSAQSLIVWELCHSDLLKRLSEALQSRGVPWLLIKGTALAYCYYEQPWLRSRGDTDILVRHEDKDLAIKALQDTGFEPSSAIPEREWSSYQNSYSVQTRDGSNHTIDLHWRILNSALLTRILSFDEVWKLKCPVDKLGKEVWTLTSVHALILASVHRRVHEIAPYYVGGEVQYSGERLIWLYDIHLLACRMCPEEWCYLLEVSHSKGLSGVVLDTLNSASRRFGTLLPSDVVSLLQQDKRESEVLKYLDAGRTGRELKDLLALESVRHKMAFVREVLFPPAGHWSAEDRAGHPLVLNYGSRIAKGIAKRLWKSGTA